MRATGDLARRDTASFEELDLALDPDFEHLGEVDARRAWKRSSVVRIVEYSPYPRSTASEHAAIGFTANESRGGLCMLTREIQPVGQALRLTVREVDGRTRLEAIARVVWCNPAAGDRVALGIELLEVRRGAEALRRTTPREAAAPVVDTRSHGGAPPQGASAREGGVRGE